MSELVKVKAYYVVRSETKGTHFAMHSGPFDYFKALEKRNTLREKHHHFYEIIYTDIVGELLL